MSAEVERPERSSSADDLDHRTFRRRYAVILVAALLWRVGYVLVFKRNDIPVGDQIYYSAQASTIANGGGYSYPFPPGGPGANHAPLTADRKSTRLNSSHPV